MIYLMLWQGFGGNFVAKLVNNLRKNAFIVLFVLLSKRMCVHVRTFPVTPRRERQRRSCFELICPALPCNLQRGRRKSRWERVY